MTQKALSSNQLLALGMVAVLAIGTTSFAAFAHADTNTNAAVTSTVGTSTISGIVFNDANRNKVQDPGESGISNLLIWLHLGKHKNSTVVATTTTNSLGQYMFSNLASGTYFVQQQIMAGFHIFGHNKKVTVGAGASTTVNFADVAASSTPRMGHKGNDGDKDDRGMLASTTASTTISHEGEGKGMFGLHLPNLNANFRAFLGGDNGKHKGNDQDQDDN